MKAAAFTLGILATSFSFAGYHAYDDDASSGESCCTECCTSPTPCSDIDCLSFVPQWYNLSCDCGYFFTIDFLYFYGRETNLSYAAKVKTVSNSMGTNGTAGNFTSPTRLEYLDAKWDPGVRLGFGWNLPCDGWDLALYWTYYRNTSKQTQKVGNPTGTYPSLGNFAFINQWSEYTAFEIGNVGNSFSMFTQAEGNWKFSYNNFDLVLGKRYWLSPCFTFRPFTGLRGLWAETDFTVITSRPLSSSAEVKTKSDFNNHAWAVGFIGGVEPTWFFTPCFSLFSGLTVGLGWGDHSLRKKDKTTSISGSSSLVNFKKKFSSCDSYMTPTLDLALGLRFENYYCDNQYHLQFDLGWEHHVLFHLNDRYQISPIDQTGIVVAPQSVAQSVATYSETHHDVSFGGLVLRARLDF